MIWRERGSGQYFDPSHLLEEAISNGFPLDINSPRAQQVIRQNRGRTPEQARYGRGRVEFPGGPGSGPPVEVPGRGEPGPPDDLGGPP